MTPTDKEFRKIVTELRVAIASVDVVIFSIKNDKLHVLLIPVDRPPFYSNMHGLPGGVIGVSESAEEAALRHLEMKTQNKDVHIEQLYTFSDPNRDKRSRSISVAYMALLPSDRPDTPTGEEGHWHPISSLPSLAYDHSIIIEVAVERLRAKLSYTNIVSNLLPKKFTFSELQNVYEALLGQPLDKRNFRKKIMSLGIIKSVGKQKIASHRPAELFSFRQKEIVSVSIL